MISVVLGVVLLCVVLAVVAKAVSRNVAHLDDIATRIRYSDVVNEEEK